eukprot:3720895-Pleurochrysis_carterae.AAC.1
MEDAEPEAGVSGGLDRGEDAESSGQAEHAASGADDAMEHSSSAEASDAGGGGEKNDSRANSDSLDCGNPGENAEAPTPVDGQDDSLPEDAAQPSGPAVQESTEEPDYKYSRRQVRLCQTPE